MNKKAFLKWQVKESLPIYIISFILLATIFWFTILNSKLIPSYYQNPNSSNSVAYYASAIPPIFAIGVPVILLSFVLPFGSFSYQTSHIRSDFFYQVPLKEKELRRIRLLLNLVIACIIITIVYWIGVLFILSKQTSMNAQSDYFKDNPYFYNYIYFLPYYFVFLVSFACNYFISSYFISLGTRVVDSVFYLIFGQFLLGLTVCAFCLTTKFLLQGGQVSDFLSEVLSAFPSPSWIEPLVETYLFSSLLMNNASFSSNVIGVRIVSSVSFLLLGGFLTWYMLFKKKDPSGEYAGRGTPNNLYKSLYPHAFSFVSGLFLACFVADVIYGLGTIAPIFFIFWGTVYYFSIVLTNGGFRFHWKNWIGFGAVAIVILFLTLLLSILRK